MDHFLSEHCAALRSSHAVHLSYNVTTDDEYQSRRSQETEVKGGWWWWDLWLKLCVTDLMCSVDHGNIVVLS